ncbi:MAG: cytochrome c3 family protein [Bryobacteraceae bacterium]
MLLTAIACLFTAQAADFSHALHAKLTPGCTSCHATAATSTRLEDNLLPGADACRPCHESVQIKQPAKTRLAKFDHAFHAKFGNVAPLIAAAIKANTYLGDAAARAASLNTANACAACHRGIESSTSVSTKNHHPEMADCLVCHNKIDPPFSCETCHGNDKTLKPATHTARYIDTHTTKSEKTGCASCHGKRFSCQGCH